MTISHQQVGGGSESTLRVVRIRQCWALLALRRMHRCTAFGALSARETRSSRNHDGKMTDAEKFEEDM